MSRSHQSRTLTVLAATAFAAAVVPVLGAGTASATTGGTCQSATVQYRIDGGDWTSQGGFHAWDSAPGAVEVRLAPGQSVGEGCKYPVSLAEYTTEGPNWNTSGRQTFVDKDTVYLTSADVADAGGAERAYQKLSVKTPDCYGQIDLYGDDIAYDGQEGEGHGPLPYQPDGVVTPYHLIAAWNGGDKACDDGASVPPAPTPSEPAPSTPDTPTTPATPTTPEGSEPPAEESTPPTTPDTSTTPPTTPDVPPAESTPPTGPEPTPSESTPPLAETGAGAPVGTIAGAAAVVVAIGAGALFMARRARRS
ncbi:hypothetical protein GCM10023084_38840 [Streptomyces lacrimifluminis]|uniref:Gram-positive cocci surface proteins LPxTG domain-containing protein n=1 Tax=Streptomyces lacrimifluminis TaxID=1500077 RepID=A0A917NZE6_9ACTN|nr:hypothetical protein [Streptomyces lacrimifluminis]GGJ39727.1 hypothetical protein GCM10012282_40460 [Streptomyces lacrimifluminis]